MTHAQLINLDWDWSSDSTIDGDSATIIYRADPGHS